ncbi:hypothetical protein ABEM22_23280, partial [Escherichia coli]
ACYGIKIDHTERETTGVVGKAERLTWHKAWTMVSTGFSISYTLNQKGHIRREAAYQSNPVVHHVQMAWGDIQ